MKIYWWMRQHWENFYAINTSLVSMQVLESIRCASMIIVKIIENCTKSLLENEKLRTMNDLIQVTADCFSARLGEHQMLNSDVIIARL